MFMNLWIRTEAQWIRFGCKEMFKNRIPCDGLQLCKAGIEYEGV